MTIRILLADNHQRMREAMRALIDRQPGMQVVAEAGKGRTTVELARAIRTVVVNQIYLGSGIEERAEFR